jgi:hypothetical protein
VSAENEYPASARQGAAWVHSRRQNFSSSCGSGCSARLPGPGGPSVIGGAPDPALACGSDGAKSWRPWRACLMRPTLRRFGIRRLSRPFGALMVIRPGDPGWRFASPWAGVVAPLRGADGKHHSLDLVWPVSAGKSPSLTFTIWFGVRFRRRSTWPLGQRISTSSIISACPSPNRTRRSFWEK